MMHWGRLVYPAATNHYPSLSFLLPLSWCSLLPLITARPSSFLLLLSCDVGQFCLCLG